MNLSVLIASLMLVAAVARPDTSSLVERLSDAESTEGWSGPVALVRDAHEGRAAIAATMPAGKVGFASFRFEDRGIDLSEAHALAFWWKVEGDGLRDFMVKVRNAPLAQGMEAVYSVWNPDMGDAPTEWTRAVIVLSEPLYDDWGDRPDPKARYVTFRTTTEKDAHVRLFLDEVLAIAPTFTWRVGPLESDEGDWNVPVSFRDLGDAPLRVVLGYGKRERLRVAIEPRAEVTRRLSLDFVREKLARLEPLQALRVSLWAQVESEPVTRTERIINVVKPIELPPHPRLLLTAEGVAAVRDRIASYEWARKRWEGVRAFADQVLSEEVKLPPRGGNWWHWYACPEHGAPLRTGKRIGEWQWEHICPVDGKVHLGDPSDPSRDYDGVVLSSVHSRWARAVRDLGLAYQITDERRYAEKAREILLAYADRYLSYPLHTIRNEPKIGGGRVGPQTLDEASWLIPMAQGADLVWETLSDADRETLASRLFQPAAREVILPHKLGVHNIQCWKNSAVGLVGFLLGDDELIYEAIENPERGFRRQIADGVRPDGSWWEGAWGYHFYTLSALWSLTEAARNSGIDLYGGKLKSMFDAPLTFAMPDLSLPAFNDSGPVRLAGRASLYELAYARYRDPDYLDVLATSNRVNDDALWFGVGSLPEAPPRTWTSANTPASGVAILAKGEGKGATWLALKYGPHGGGHGHPDKLNFVLYAQGRVLAVDPGTARYGLPIQRGWYRTTLAHNTLVVDGASQRPAEGESVAFGTDRGVDVVIARAGDIYDGVRFTRTVALLSEDLVLFVDQIRAETAHTFDLAYHQRGAWERTPPGEPWTVPDRDGYRYLRDASTREIEGDEGASLSIRIDEGRFTVLTLAGGAPTELITATGVGDQTEDRVPVAIFRRRGSTTAVAWALSLDGSPTTIRWRPVRDSSGELVDASRAAAVTVTHRDRTWNLLTNPDGETVRVEPSNGEAWSTAERFAVR